MTRLTSTARVATDRGARYGEQLASHLGRKADAKWDDAAAAGRVTFDGGTACVDMRAEPDALVFELHTPAALADRFEDIVGRHLVRFGARDELQVTWTRSDGTPGTRQTAQA